MKRRYNPFDDPQYTDWLNQLREIPMEEVADTYDVERRGMTILCPEHDDKNIGNCSIYHNRYYCFACHAKGDNIRLVQKIKGIGFMAAARDLAASFGYPIYETGNRKAFSTGEIDYMPVTKKQLTALGLLPNKTAVFVVERYQTWKDNDMISKPDLGDDNTGYMIGGTMMMSPERLYKEDKEGFFALIAGKFREMSSLYLTLYQEKVWELKIFPDVMKPDMQGFLEETLLILNELAKNMVEQRLLDLSYFKLPKFQKKGTRYQLQL